MIFELFIILLTRLNRIERMLVDMSQMEADLDVALGVVQDKLSALVETVQAAVDKLGNVHGVDLSDETAALTKLADDLQSANESLGAAVNSDSGPTGSTGASGPAEADVPVEDVPVSSDTSF